MAAPDPKQCFQDGMNAQLMGRMGTVEESAKLCLFLASEATFTTVYECVCMHSHEYGDMITGLLPTQREPIHHRTGLQTHTHSH